MDNISYTKSKRNVKYRIARISAISQTKDLPIHVLNIQV